jgi:hypothetical protein
VAEFSAHTKDVVLKLRRRVFLAMSLQKDHHSRRLECRCLVLKIWAYLHVGADLGPYLLGFKGVVELQLSYTFWFNSIQVSS